MINDAPLVIADSGENTFWRPHNDTLKFYGMTSLREALAESRNVVSVRLLQAIGIPYALQFLQRFGFDSKQLPHTLSLALGSGGVTPLSLASGYTIFANHGYRTTPHLIAQVIDQSGKVIIANHYPIAPDNSQPNTCATQSGTCPQQPIAPHALSPQINYLMTSAMQDVIRQGTGRKALALHRNDLAGKNRHDQQPS